jgi:hypothetical protein
MFDSELALIAAGKALQWSVFKKLLIQLHKVHQTGLPRLSDTGNGSYFLIPSNQHEYLLSTNPPGLYTYYPDVCAH